jgi:hypothetical protein
LAIGHSVFDYEDGILAPVSQGLGRYDYHLELLGLSTASRALFGWEDTRCRLVPANGKKMAAESCGETKLGRLAAQRRYEVGHLWVVRLAAAYIDLEFDIS